MRNKIVRRSALRRAGAALAGSAALLVAVTPAASADTGLVALWHMDETSGSVMKDAVGSHSGKLQSVQLGQSGFLGKAYGFTGSSKVTVASASDLNPGSKDITITIHLKATSVPDKPDWDLIRKGKADTSGGEWKMEYQPSGQASCGFKGKTSSSLTKGPALNNGKWHTVQCVKTSSTIKLIVDGQTYSKSVSVGSISNTAPILIGSHGGSEFFKGSLDEASIQIG
jgi:hypothetical protein